MTMTPLPLEPPFGHRDPHGMAALVDAIPEQVEQALARTNATPWQKPKHAPDLVAFGGMGGSAIAGELTGATYADELPHPWLVVRDYQWPACVTAGSLAVLSSNSGDTQETLALEAQARQRGVPCVAISSGGELSSRAMAGGYDLQHVPGGMPPRAALFHAWVPVSRLPAALGWTADPEPDWREAVSVLREYRDNLGVDAPESRNPAKQLARMLVGRTVLIYSGPGGPAAVGTRWRQQLNENAKILAHSAAVPEQNHNEIVGWQVASDATSAVSIVLLRDREDSAEVTLRLRLASEYAVRQGATVHQATSDGESRIARLASLAQFGDYVSLYLALAGGVDPTDITSIDDFKRRLAESAQAR
ncbi:MAG: bifunctional phosphoglucose/phosphomannose isomerase [Candidatus Eisenbacteria bacterium]